MTELGRRTSLAVVVVALSLVGPGCTNSDPLSAQPGQVQVIVSVQPAGAAGFDSFILILRQIGLDVIREGSDQSMGTNPIGSVVSQVSFNLADGGERQIGTLTLPVGRYQVSKLDFDYTGQNPPMFLEASPVRPSAPCDPSNCLDYVVYRTGTPVDPDNPDGERFSGKLPPPELATDEDLDNPAYRITPLPSAPTFDVNEGTGTRLTLMINGAGLAQLFRNGYTCRCTPNCIVNNITYLAPCLPDFVKPTQAELLSHITIQ